MQELARGWGSRTGTERSDGRLGVKEQHRKQIGSYSSANMCVDLSPDTCIHSKFGSKVFGSTHKSISKSGGGVNLGEEL